MKFWYEYRKDESPFSEILIAYWPSNDLFLFLYLSTCNNKLLNHFNKYRIQLKWYWLFFKSMNMYDNEHINNISFFLKTYLAQCQKIKLCHCLSWRKLNYIDKDLLLYCTCKHKQWKYIMNVKLKEQHILIHCVNVISPQRQLKQTCQLSRFSWDLPDLTYCETPFLIFRSGFQIYPEIQIL